MARGAARPRRRDIFPIGYAGGAAPPLNTALPAISGTPAVGQTLTSDTGTWTGTPAPTYAYQWKNAGAAISGATSSTYLLQTSDEADLVTVTVSATNTQGTVSATSAAVGPVAAAPHNLVVASKDATNNAVAVGVTITANVTTGPLGDATADQLAFSGGNNGFFYKTAAGAAISGNPYCGSVSIKAAAPVQIAFRTTSGDGTGTHGVVLANVTTAWQRFSTSCIAGTAAAIQVGFDIRSFVTGDDGLAKTVIAADWQINRGIVPTDFVPT